MARVRRNSPDAFHVLAERLESLGNAVGKAGFFASSKYPDGTPVAMIAQVQEFGAHINHPGGTPYKVTDEGAVFVPLSAPGASSLPKTKPHAIVIPPRPFMAPTVARMSSKWREMLISGAKACFAGNVTGRQVMEAVAGNAAGEIQRSITLVQSPPLAKSTIRKRLAARADKKTIGNLTKPLEDTQYMIGSVTHAVEDE